MEVKFDFQLLPSEQAEQAVDRAELVGFFLILLIGNPHAVIEADHADQGQEGD